MKTTMDEKTAERVSLGEIRIAGRGELIGHGEGSVVTHQPDEVYLQNDGRWDFWMQPNHRYMLVRDEIGWVVTCRSWPPVSSIQPHVYRLATGGYYTNGLPVGDGMVELDSAKRYELVPARGSWELYEVG